MESLIILANCQMARCAQDAASCQPRGCDSAVCITIIICATILLLGIVLANMICRMKNKQLLAKQEEEKELYRSKLVNILELRAKGIKTQDRNNLSFENGLCEQYINELKSLINNLKPTPAGAKTGAESGTESGTETGVETGE